jgi:hypothetical protein
MTKSRHYLIVLGTILQLFVAASSTVAAQNIELMVRSAPTANAGGELVSLPTVAVAPVDSAAIPSAVGQQLTASVTLAKRDRPDADDFVVLTRPEPNSSEVRWAFAARTDDRQRYAALTSAFAGRLTACLYALESDAQVAALVALLSSISVSSPELESAGYGGRLMLEHWKEDQCQTARNSLVLIEQQSQTILAATRGMLTDRFDALLFRGEALLSLIAVLKPVFFGSSGLWESDRGPQLRAMFDRALEQGFVSAAAIDAVRDLEFASFFDWVIYVRRLQPTLPRELYQSAGAACLSSVAEASQAFRLQRCVDSGHIHWVGIRFGGTQRFSLRPETAP